MDTIVAVAVAVSVVVVVAVQVHDSSFTILKPKKLGKFYKFDTNTFGNKI